MPLPKRDPSGFTQGVPSKESVRPLPKMVPCEESIRPLLMRVPNEESSK